VRSLRAALPLREVRVVGRTPGAGEALAAELGGAACEAGRALAGAHVVVCATNCRTPLFPAGAVEPGTHVCLVGSGSAGAAEVEPRLLARAESVRVDHRPTCLTESGEIVGALREGLIDEGAVRELGEVVLGRVPGRLSADGITVYKSVGNGAEDAGLAAALLGRL
jgi:ornithine cyclodeaminase